MHQNFQLIIPRPCKEDWNKMTPAGRGRYCLNCQKELADFSNLGDDEIFTILSKSNGKICARISPSQLNRKMELPLAPRSTWWKHWMGVAASLLLLFSKGQAQGKIVGDTILYTKPLIPEPLKIENLQSAKSDKPDKAPGTHMLHGKISDKYHQPIGWAIITVGESGTGVRSSNDGSFAIAIPENSRKKLVIAAIGYVTRYISVKKQLRNRAQVILEMEQAVSGELDLVEYKRYCWIVDSIPSIE